jgi:hypothetical protein
MGAAVMLAGMLVVMSGRIPVAVAAATKAPAKREPAVAQ